MCVRFSPAAPFQGLSSSTLSETPYHHAPWNISCAIFPSSAMPRRKRAAAASRENGKVKKLAVAEPKAKPKSCLKLRGLAAAVQHARQTFRDVVSPCARVKAIDKILDKAKYIQDIRNKMRPPKKKPSKILREVNPCSPSMPLSPRNLLLTCALPCPQRAGNKVQFTDTGPEIERLTLTFHSASKQPKITFSGCFKSWKSAMKSHEQMWGSMG